MSDFVLGRSGGLNTWAVRIAYVMAGLTGGLNIHISAIVIKRIAQANGIGEVSSWLAGSTAYIAAVGVTCFCFIWVGCLLHPAGIPTVMTQVKAAQKSGAGLGRLLALVVSVGLLAGFGYALTRAYAYDLFTTQSYFGTQDLPLTDLLQIPVWICVGGPEALTVGANFLGKLNGRRARRADDLRSAEPANYADGPQSWDYLR